LGVDAIRDLQLRAMTTTSLKRSAMNFQDRSYKMYVRFQRSKSLPSAMQFGRDTNFSSAHQIVGHAVCLGAIVTAWFVVIFSH
jgi:hypothetical protein